MSLSALKLLTDKARSREFISGGGERFISPLLQNAVVVLGQFQDDLNKEFSDRAYDEMMRDPAVSASVDILKSLILAEPLRVQGKIQDKKNPDYAKSKEIADFIKEQFENTDRPAQVILWEALEAIQYGSSFVEIVYEDDTYEGRPILRLKDLKTRNRRNYSVLVDRFFNVLGAISIEEGSMNSSVYTGSTDPDPSKVIPREKFCMISLMSKYGDPRGISLLRPAWNSYYLKTKAFPAYEKFLVQFATPIFVGYTPENSTDEVEQRDANGNLILNADGTTETITPEEDMLETLLGLQGGTVAVLKGGSKLDALRSQGEGDAFSKAVDLFDRQIAMAILKTHRTLLESKHSSKADSESAADITDVFVSYLRDVVSGSLTRDVVRQLVKINFGEETMKRFCPVVTLKAVPKQDFAKTADAVSKLWTAEYLDDTQVEGTDAMMGLPERDMDAFLERQDEKREMANIASIESMKMKTPGAGTTPAKEEGGDDLED